MAERLQISHYYTTGITSPSTSKLIHGELAMSIKSGYETLFLKNTDGKITRFSSDEKFLKQKNIFSGNTTFNSGITVNNSNKSENEDIQSKENEKSKQVFNEKDEPKNTKHSLDLSEDKLKEDLVKILDVSIETIEID